MKYLKLIIPFCGLATRLLFAFPEMVRHGYMSCTTCHVSPDGGGVLTGYGRVLSGEVLSRWAAGEDEGNFLYGAFRTPDWFQMGGDFRFVQTYQNTTTKEAYRFINMQADLEGAITKGKFTGVATIGYRDSRTPRSFTESLISRRHYLLYRHNDEYSVRAGRFPMAFGVRLPDHVLEIRRGLGWDQEMESYNLEGLWSKDPFDVFVTAVLGRLDSPSLNRELGGSLRASFGWSEKYKVGLSYFYGTNKTASRHVTGPYGILGFTKKFFLISEVDFQHTTANSEDFGPWSIINYNRLQYEFWRGFHVFLTQEFSGLLKAYTNDKINLGAGVQIFPRPHFEFQIQYQKSKNRATDNSWNDIAWLLLHAYL